MQPLVAVGPERAFYASCITWSHSQIRNVQSIYASLAEFEWKIPPTGTTSRLRHPNCPAIHNLTIASIEYKGDPAEHLGKEP